MIFIRSAFLYQFKCFDTSHSISAGKLKSIVSAKFAIPIDMFDVHSSKCKLEPDAILQHGCTVYLLLAVPGGKGGFGSMLRAIGAQIEKTTNREACRDLSGRRLRDINEEQRLKNWLAKKVEREEAAAQRRKERLQRLKEPGKHNFHDPEYNKERSELPERVDDALSAGLRKASGSTTTKRSSDPNEQGEPSKKKKSLWLGVDLPSESENSSDEEQGPKLQESDDNAVSMNFTDTSNSDIPDSQIGNNAISMSSTDTSNSNQNKLLIENDSDQGSSGASTDEYNPPDNCATNDKDEGADVDINKQGKCNPPADVAEHCEEVNLESFNSIEQLEELGLEKLKSILVNLGLKCGGTLTERAQRLLSLRGLKYEDYPSSLKAKPTKKK